MPWRLTVRFNQVGTHLTVMSALGPMASKRGRAVYEVALRGFERSTS
jgi:hypothetical protein